MLQPIQEEAQVDVLEVRRWAHQLARAEATCTPMEPLSAQTVLTVDDAYAIQRAGVEQKVAQGDRVLGYKIGLTSRAMQAQLGVTEPDFGHLLQSMVVEAEQAVTLAALIQPRVEAELAWILDRELSGPGVTVTQVVRATAFVAPALEVIDSRIREWRIQLVDTVADNASAARFVVGTRWWRPTEVDWALVGVVVRQNGQVVETAAGAATLGHPVYAATWLINALGHYGVTVAPGTIILTGSLGRALTPQPGDVVEAQFSAGGSVSCRFVEGRG